MRCVFRDAREASRPVVCEGFRRERSDKVISVSQLAGDELRFCFGA